MLSPKKLNNQLGFSLIEIIVAMSLSLGGLLAVGTAMKYVGEKNQNNQHIMSMLALEQQIVSAFLEPNNYTTTDIQSMTNGNVPTDVRIRIQDTTFPEFRLGTTHITNPKLMTEPRTVCTNFTNPNCIFKIDLDLKKVGDFFYYAYRITLNPKFGAIISLGAHRQTSADLFKNEDYQVQVPVSLYPPPVTVDLDCSAQTDKAFATGIVDNRLVCVNKPRPSDACPSNTVAKHLEVVSDSGEKYLKLNCQPTKVFCCPSDYVLQRVDMRASDPNGQQFESQNRCVFAARNTAPSALVTKGPGYSIIGEVCPPKYRSVSTCRLTSGLPILCYPTPADRVNSGRIATCEVNGLATSCSAAKVTLTVRCELDTENYPQYINPTAHTSETCPIQTPNEYTDTQPENLFVVGSCGASANQSFSNYPASNHCSNGQYRLLDSIGLDGFYNWACFGTGGGGDATCSATKL